MINSSNYPDDVFDYKINKKAIDSMIGILLFPVVNEDSLGNGFSINGSEKSFWSTKVKASLKIEYLKKIDIDLSNRNYGFDSINQYPENSNVLLQFEFNTVYSHYTSTEQFIFAHDLHNTRKEILSFGILVDILDTEIQVYKDLSLNYINSGGKPLDTELVSTEVTEIEEIKLDKK